MPTILRSGGLRVVIYLNDHPPAHVHVSGPGWAVVVNLIGLRLIEVINGSESDARRAVRLVASNRRELMDAWRQIHGGVDSEGL